MFAVVYPDGTIATFYKPNWEGQVKRYGNTEQKMYVLWKSFTST